MSKFFSTASLFWGTLLAISAVPKVGISATNLNCPEIATGQISSWPPKSWDAYLNSLPESKDEIPLVDFFPIKPVDSEPPLNDARIYTLHMRVKSAKDLTQLQNPDPEIQLPDYEFVGGFVLNGHPGMVGPFGKFMVVRSKKSGLTLTVPGFPRRPKGVWRSTYATTLNSYLAEIEDIVTMQKQDSRLDYFFRLLEREEEGPTDRWEVFKTEPWAESDKSSDPSYQKESVVVASYDGGDTQRVATKETYYQEGFWVTNVDASIRRGRVKVHGESAPTQDQTAEGRATQRKWINEIVGVPYQAYVERRPELGTESFIKEDYSEVLESSDRTRYIRIQDDDGGRPGRVIGIIGLNRAPYEGMIRFYDDKLQWQDAFFAAGIYFMQDFTGPAYAEKEPLIGKLSIQTIPLLKMEKFLNKHLRRLIAIETIVWDTPVIFRDRILMNWPTFHGQGIIYEPVKFYLDPSAPMRDEAETTLVSVLASDIVPSYRDPLFSLMGQWLGTFNPPKKGRKLYGPRGYQPDSNYEIKSKNGEDWQIFSQSPKDFLMKFKKLSPADQKLAAGRFLRSLQVTAERLGR